MKKAHSFLIALGSLATIPLLSACASDLGSPDGQEEDGTGGDSAFSGGAGTGGAGTGGTGTGTGGAGTGGDSAGTGGAPEVTYHPGYQALLDVLSGFRIGRPDYSCASSDCHSGGHDHSAVPLRLVEDADLYTELTTHVSVKCGNLKTVEPGVPAESALVKVLKEGCTDVVPPDAPIPRMPYDCVQNEFENTCVADEHIAAIEQWILDGAPQF